MAFASLVLISSFFIPYIAEAIIYFPEMNGYIDPFSKKYTVVGQVMNSHPTQKPVGNLTIGIQFIDQDEKIIAEKNVRVSKLLPLGEINVPYLVPIPFKIVLEDASLSQRVKYATEGAMQLNESKNKPADLLLLSKEIYLIDTNEYGKKWAIRALIKNNYTEPAENVYAVATLYNASDHIIGVAGFDSVDKQSLTIAPMQTKEFVISTWLPFDMMPAKSIIHAESKNSVLRHPYYFPLLPHHKLLDDVGSYTASVCVGQGLHFASNISSIFRDDLDFYWILQIKKLPKEDPLGFPMALHQSVTERIEIIHSSVKPLNSAVVDFRWIPEQQGRYFYEIAIWSSLDNPTPLSYYQTDRFYSGTQFYVC